MEPHWIDDCFCENCLDLRDRYGYDLIDGEWVKRSGKED